MSSTGTVAVDPVIQRVVQAFYPLPNAGLLGSGDEGIYLSTGQKVTPGNHASVQVNRKFSGKDSLFGIYLFDQGSVLANAAEVISTPSSPHRS